MSRAAELRGVFRITPQTWPPALVALLVAVACSLRWIFRAVDRILPTNDAVYLAVNLAIPVLLLAPFLAYALLWRRMGRGARIRSGALLAIYGAWAWPRPLRALQFVPVAVRAAAEARAETGPARRAMRAGPREAARKAAAAGETSFLAVAGYSVAVPGVENPCVLARWGQRVIRGTGDAPRTPGHARFQQRAQRFAEAYNAALAARLGISPAELARDGRCTLSPRMDYWPSGPEVAA